MYHPSSLSPDDDLKYEASCLFAACVRNANKCVYRSFHLDRQVYKAINVVRLERALGQNKNTKNYRTHII